MKIAVVLVHYHTPQLLLGAIEALQKDAQRAGVKLEGKVVDNGSRPEDQELLSSLPFPVLTPSANVGYAGGANLGLRSTEAALAILMNPDVVVLPGCLAALIEALQDGVSVAGPRFYWDAERQFQLPPTETVGRPDELLRLFAERGGSYCRWARRRWRRHSRRFFLAEASLASFDLSGALLALRRDAWQEVGPLDESYALYFEETDWLQRMRRVGKDCRFVPAAEAVHLYAQSTVKEGRAEQWFEESQRRFRQRLYGPRWTRLMEHLATRWHRPFAADLSASPSPPGQQARWLEVSARLQGFPAAVRRLENAVDPFHIPETIRRRIAPGTYYLRLVGEEGRELDVRQLVVES